MRRTSRDRSGVRGGADRVRRDWGRVVSVRKRTAGRPVTAAAAVGATTVAVRNGGLFGDRGSVKVGDQVTRHTGWNETTGLLTIVDPLVAALAVDDRVFVYDRGRDTVVTDLEVLVDRDDDAGAPLPVYADAGMVDVLPPGPREAGEGEVVRIEYDPDDDEWRITSVPGMAEAAGLKWERSEPHYSPTQTEVDARAFTRSLLRSRIVGTHEFAVTVNGVDLGFEHVSLDGDAGVVTVIIPTWCTTAEHFMFPPYAYRAGPAAPLSVPIGHSWKYAVNLGASTTFAQPAFNDSAWATGPSPFGWGVGAGAGIPPIATPVGGLGSPMDVWCRIKVRTLGGALTFSTPLVDNNARVYLDGVEIWAPAYPSSNATLTVACAPGDHTIAIRGTGDGQIQDYSAFEIMEAA